MMFSENLKLIFKIGQIKEENDRLLSENNKLKEEYDKLKSMIGSIHDFERIRSVSDYINNLPEDIKAIDALNQFDFNSVINVLVNCGHPTRLKNVWGVVWRKAVDTGTRNNVLVDLMIKLVELYNEANPGAQLQIIYPEVNVPYSSSEHERPTGKQVTSVKEVIFPGLRNNREILFKPVVG